MNGTLHSLSERPVVPRGSREGPAASDRGEPMHAYSAKVRSVAQRSK